MRNRAEATITCQSSESSKTCNVEEGCLFSIDQDPCEKNNVLSLYPDVVAQIKNLVKDFEDQAVPPTNGHNDPKADAKWSFFFRLIIYYSCSKSFFFQELEHGLDQLERFLKVEPWKKVILVLNASYLVVFVQFSIEASENLLTQGFASFFGLLNVSEELLLQHVA